MDAKYAKLIADAGDALGHDMEARDGYSGRGMFGEATSAVVFESWPEFAAAVVRAALDIREGMVPAADGCDVMELLDVLPNLRSDSMGRSMIAY